jgi:uncharacterized protein (TIGR04255 family)
MPFQERPRVIYKRNPLKEVICQLKFPPILLIDSKLPAGFQERIRGSYPILREIAVPQAPSIVGLPEELSNLLGMGLPGGRITREFLSADEKWKVSLSRDFLALTCTDYVRWELFKEHLQLPFNALVEEYAPSFCVRVGLRYRDVIEKSMPGLDPTVTWKDLLQPHIAGELVSPEIAGHIRGALRQLIVQLDNEMGQVQIQHGLSQNKKTGEPVYFIDSDFSTSDDQKTEIGRVIERLNYFNRQAARLFRWCITDRLHNAMEPTPI